MGKPNLAGVGIRRLVWDIETAPCLVLAFQTGFQVNVNYDGIVQERRIICIGYKWEHEKKVHVLRWDENQDDKAMLVKFLDVLNSADEAIAHYGDRFDLPWVRTRCLVHGLEPLPLYKTIDTKAWASKYFYFESNKLDYLSKVLGYGGKLKTDFDLWKDIVLHKSKQAMDKMCRYCAVDVLKLEKVYKRLRACVKPKSHVGVMNGNENHSCPHCGGDHSEYFRKRVSASGVVQHQRRCLTCKSYFVISDSANKKYNKQRNGKG